jgi:hypothetical protein
MLALTILELLLLAGPPGATALLGQPSPSTPRQRLAGASSANCTFSAVATAEWAPNGPQAVVKSAKLTVAFDSINADEGSGRALGDFGPLGVVVRLSGTALHFLQTSLEGPIYLTTIFSKETRPGYLLAAHTRHEFTDVSLPGFTSRPEQYYGECTVRP